jgi:single-strand DNA-binding protein
MAAQTAQVTRTTRTKEQRATDQPFNQVKLVGRVAAPAETKEMPSGDLMTTFRVIVPREPEPGGGGHGGAHGRKGGVDTIECVAWRAGLRRTVNSWQEGDMVAVTGALRRRFWRGQAGPSSRHEIEVLEAARVRRASP